MQIPFNLTPSTGLVVPNTGVEVQTRPSNPGGFRRALIIAPVLAGSAMAASGMVNIPVIYTGLTNLKAQAGAGSVMARMADQYTQIDQTGELWVLPVADDPGAVASAGNVIFTGPATATGVLSTYISNDLIPVTVTTGMTAAQIATAFAAAINANTDLPVTATVDGTNTAKVNFTPKNLGQIGNEIDIRFNYGGVIRAEAFPAGVGATVTAMASGATNATLTTALANTLDTQFDFIALAYNDSASRLALKNYLDWAVGRWAWNSMLFGMAFNGYRGSYGNQTTFGAATNDAHMITMGFNDSPSASYEWAAAVCASAAVSARANPGQGITGALVGIGAPPAQSRFSKFPQRNTLLQYGISTFTVAADGTVSVEKLVTGYLTNGLGQPDTTLRDAEKLFCLMVALRTMIASRAQFSRRPFNASSQKLVGGSGVVTPAIINASDIATYKGLERDGIVQNSDGFAAALITQQNSTNPNRVDTLWPFVEIDQIDVMAILVQLSNY